MIDYQVIKQLSGKYQTGEKNVVREYLQHLFAQFFYSQPESENFLFKGGTALRLVYHSPRFSEDIDFSGIKNGVRYENILEKVIERFALEGFECELVESKATSGGWLAILRFLAFGKTINIRNEISFRGRQIKKEAVMISSDFIPAYKLFLLSPDKLVKEKIAALLTRNKTRDIFDLYFILRNHSLRKYAKLNKNERALLVRLFGARDNRLIKNELQPLLSTGFLPVIKNLPERLIKELE